MEVKQHDNIDELISRYLSDQTDKEALTELKQLAEESESARKYICEQIDIYFTAGVLSDEHLFDKKQAFERFQKRITKKGNRTYIIPWKWAVRVAAVILILLLPFFTYQQGKETVKQNFADIVVEAPIGARTKLYLPDGTLVWLNASSKITYSQGFGVDNRCLTLEGEGYFEVARNKEIPFKINTNEVNLKVLGTKFNFKNYPDDEEIIINLFEGKVALHNEIRSMAELYMEPNEKMTMNKRTGEMIKVHTNVSNSNAWTKDELFFDEELLKDIAKRLMRNYDVRIEIADSLRDRRFYGSFKITGTTIDEVLETIASTNRMKYRYENGIYILY